MSRSSSEPSRPGDGQMAGSDKAAEAGAIVPFEKDDRKPRGLGGFDSAPLAGVVAQLSAPADGHTPGRPEGGRQVGTRGSWAEYAITDGRSYYVNIVTGETTWTRPAGYDTVASRRGSTGLIPGPPGTEPQTGHSNLFVGNLPAGLDELSFRQLFSQYGAVVSTKVVAEARYGFVKYASVQEAQRVIDMMNGAIINGVQLAVRFANMDRR